MSERFLYGMHESPPLGSLGGVLPEGSWLLHLVEVGTSSEPHPGVDLSPWAGYENIVRLQKGWGVGTGTVPVGRLWMEYLARVRTCVENSRGAHIWQAFNEPNHPAEWPDQKPITAENAAWWYCRIRDTIHGVAGHEGDLVLLPPVAPWCVVEGVRDWMPYFQSMIEEVDGEIDGFALHAYSRGADPAAIASEARMDPPYERWRNGFRVYRDWIGAIPKRWQDRPIYLTEVNQGEEGWSEERTGWVQAMYRDIDEWNQGTGPGIQCALLYRWPHYDRWGIAGNGAVLADLQAAIAEGYVSPGGVEPEPEPEPQPEPGQPGVAEALRQVAASLETLAEALETDEG